MKRILALTLIVIAGIAALIVGQRRKADAPASADAVLEFMAGTQREMTRLPMGATRLSDAQEIQIGQELLRSYDSGGRLQTRQISLMDDYVNRVGRKLAARAHRKLPYSFHYIPDRGFINAFALPGGPVFIGEGMLSLMDSEDELAAVLGHEIEHIDHYHCAERVQVEARARKLGAIGQLATLPIEIFEAGYTKDEEMQADREGTRLAVLAGYSPTGALRIMETFDRLFERHQRRAHNPQEEVGSLAEQTLEGYFRSHPPAAERAAQIRSLMVSEGWPAKAERDLEVKVPPNSRAAIKK